MGNRDRHGVGNRSSRSFPWALIAATLACVASGAPIARAQNAQPAPGGKKITVCLLPKKKGVPYFTSCAAGAQQAADELGDVQLIYDGPTDGSPEKAAAMIERWTLQGVDVIAVSPNDPQVLAPAMKKARQKGVHIITWDADGAADAREFMVCQATPQQIGFALVDTLARDLGGDQAEGEVAIVTATLTAANQNEWIRHIRERLAAYPKLLLVGVQPSNEDQRLAYQATKDLMNAHPKLRGVWAISSVAFPGAAEAIKQSGRGGQVMVTGLSTPNDMKAYVHEGVVRSVILWNTVDLGYLTVRAAEAVATGKLKAGATALRAGRLGEKKIEGDQILLGDILVFTRDNIDKFDF